MVFQVDSESAKECMDSKGAKECKYDRSRQEFSNIFFKLDPNSNEYLLAKIGVDTAENQPLKVWK